MPERYIEIAEIYAKVKNENPREIVEILQLHYIGSRCLH